MEQRWAEPDMKHGLAWLSGNLDNIFATLQPSLFCSYCVEV